MWSEQVQGVAVEGKLWPRVAALGERLWADPGTGSPYTTQLITVVKRYLYMAMTVSAKHIYVEISFIYRLETSGGQNGSYERTFGEQRNIGRCFAA